MGGILQKLILVGLEIEHICMESKRRGEAR